MCLFQHVIKEEISRYELNYFETFETLETFVIYTLKEVQCLKSLCWCVWTRSGKPIRGSVTKDGYNTKPDCENAKKNAKAYKGCSVKRKSVRKFHISI